MSAMQATYIPRGLIARGREKKAQEAIDKLEERADDAPVLEVAKQPARVVREARAVVLPRLTRARLWLLQHVAGPAIRALAIAGAVLAALIANYLSTERGRQFLDSASNTLKDLSSKATDFAKNNLSELVRETTNSLGPVVKEKIAQQVSKSTQAQPANQQ